MQIPPPKLYVKFVKAMAYNRIRMIIFNTGLKETEDLE